ncbi:MAG TPA: hypothetical protein VG650_05675 [Mycobacteriales bacterium]|nr:hypothetical protein [Mycobacteriales bacterium]
MNRIRCTASAAVLVALSGLTPLLPGAAHAGVVTAGRLVYVTADGELDEVTVSSDGSTGVVLRLGPITTVTAPSTVEAQNAVVSGDGDWLAWSEVISKPDPTYGSLQTGGRIAVRNLTTGSTFTLSTEDYPLGFAGHTLVVIGAHTRRLVMQPSPHLVRIHDGGAYAVATYARGIVDVSSAVGGKNDSIETDRLRLTTFAGHHTLLHRYKVGTDYRSAAANVDAVSSDGTKLLIERGNHQDFEGLGPSSLFDTFALTGAHARHQLGHYGSNASDWRMAGATFVGAHNTPWLALHSGYGSKASGYAVRGVVVRYANGQWVKQGNGIAVAGNQAGYVAIQGGTWEPVKNSPAGEYQTSPGGSALLEGPGGQHPLSNVSATQLLWVE